MNETPMRLSLRLVSAFLFIRVHPWNPWPALVYGLAFIFKETVPKLVVNLAKDTYDFFRYLFVFHSL